MTNETLVAQHQEFSGDWDHLRRFATLADTRAHWQAYRQPRKVDLRGMTWPKLILGTVDVAGVLLDGANLADAKIKGAKLCGASLVKADLSGALLWNADLRGADLRGARFQGADLEGADPADPLSHTTGKRCQKAWPMLK